MKVLISEKLSAHKVKTPEGYLICSDAILARTGKQTYTRDELFHDGDNSEIEVDRTPEEVFSEETLASFENKPLTITHPDEDVTPDNYKELGVGFVRDVRRATRDGQEVMVANIVVTDAEAIEAIESGELLELSCGYDCDISDDEHPCQRNIRGNHVALCKQGRAGNARIVDSIKEEQPSIKALGKWEWDEVMQDWYDNGRHMYYNEVIRRSAGKDSIKDVNNLTKFKTALRNISKMYSNDPGIEYVISTLKSLGYEVTVDSIDGWKENKNVPGEHIKQYRMNVMLEGREHHFLVQFYADMGEWKVKEINAYMLDSNSVNEEHEYSIWVKNQFGEYEVVKWPATSKEAAVKEFLAANPKYARIGIISARDSVGNTDSACSTNTSDDLWGLVKEPKYRYFLARYYNKKWDIDDNVAVIKAENENDAENKLKKAGIKYDSIRELNHSEYIKLARVTKAIDSTNAGLNVANCKTKQGEYMKNTKLQDKYVLYKQSGVWYGTKQENYEARMQNANAIQSFKAFNSVDDIISYLSKYGHISKEDIIVKDSDTQEEVTKGMKKNLKNFKDAKYRVGQTVMYRGKMTEIVKIEHDDKYGYDLLIVNPFYKNDGKSDDMIWVGENVKTIDCKDISDCDYSNVEDSIEDEIQPSHDNMREQIVYVMQSNVDKNLYFYIGKTHAMKEGEFTYQQYKMNGMSPDELKKELEAAGWHKVDKGPAPFIDSVKDAMLTIYNLTQQEINDITSSLNKYGLYVLSSTLNRNGRDIVLAGKGSNDVAKKSMMSLIADYELDKSKYSLKDTNAKDAMQKFEIVWTDTYTRSKGYPKDMWKFVSEIKANNLKEALQKLANKVALGGIGTANAFVDRIHSDKASYQYSGKLSELLRKNLGDSKKEFIVKVNGKKYKTTAKDSIEAVQNIKKVLTVTKK